MHERSIFMEALELDDPGERAAHLLRACGADQRLRARVEALLRRHQQSEQFVLDRAPQVDLGATIDLAPPPEGLGATVGPYRLLEAIGEGGMGTVYMAEQAQPVRRKVALKVIKPGMDSWQVVARFEAERQALALMDHPNIARVLDGGTTPSGRPYFVMELVRGVPITEYCDAEKLSIPERLELFVLVCRAVQHAHQKGVIHRDLKPSNVLVTVIDGAAVPKVIDFGVAKATGQTLTEKTLFTGFAQLLGTPLYMSPEQAQLSGVDVDTRSDIYSLGVLLYELLTGTTPFDSETLKKAAFDEMRRIIREQDPPRPSTRLSSLGATGTAVSANRKADARHLHRAVRGELDWIVMKALEKDRARRYETASALALDVQRHLNDEPVQACPPSAFYRVRKFARRNHRAAVMASFALALLVLAVGTLAASYARVQQALWHEKKALQREKETTYLQRIALAGRELGAGNVGRSEELLEDCPEHLRGWEWHFLKRQRYGNPPPMPHETTVVRVAFSPDGRQIATVCMDGTLAVRDARSGRVLQSLERRTVLLGGALVRGMAYSPDGRSLAVARNDGEVRVWDPESGKRLQTLTGHTGPAWQAAFSPDGRTLASGGSDRSVRLWDLASGQALQVFADHPAPVKGVAFRPDGRSVVAACDDGTVKVWERSTGRETFSFRGKLLAYPWSPWFSPDAKRLAWACLDGVIKVWDTTTGRLEIDQQSNTHQCRAVAFSPDGSRLAVAGFDGTLRLLDAAGGRELLTIFAHPSLVSCVAFSPDGHQLASASYDRTVRLWDATPLASDPLAPHCVTLAGHKDKISTVAFSPDGRWLASASWDRTVNVWEASPRDEGVGQGQPEPGTPGALALRYTLRGHSGIVTGLAFSPDGRTLASAGWDNTYKLWDLHTPLGDSLTEIRSASLAHRLNSIEFSPDGRLLAIGQDNGIALYDPKNGQEVHPFKRTPAPVPALAFSPDSRHLISAGASDPAVKVWDVAAERFRFEIRYNPNPNACVAVSRDGRRIAAPGPDQASGEHTVKVWDVDWDAKTYPEFRTLKGYRGYVWKVAFSPDGRYLASGSWDSTVKVWDLEAPESAEPVTLRGHAGFVLGLAFSPDGRRLASGSGYAGHGELKVWDATLWENPTSGGR